MNSKITLPELITALSQASGKSRTTCDRFLKALISIVTTSLQDGENVKIKGIGTFKVSDVEERKSVNVNTGQEMIIPGHRKVSFTPDKSIAETINAPFTLFEPVELDNEVTEEMLAQADDFAAPDIDLPVDTTEHSGESNTLFETTAGVDNKIITDTTTQSTAVSDRQVEAVEKIEATRHDEILPGIEFDTEETLEEEVAETESTEPSSATDTSLLCDDENNIEASTTDAVPTDEDREVHQHTPECRAPRFWKGILIGILIAVFAMVALFAAWRIFLPASFCSITSTLLPAHVNEVIEKPTPTPVVDTLPAEQRIQPMEPGADSTAIEPAPTRASDEKVADNESADTPKTAETPNKEKKVYDTISAKRFLTTMAKEHYGDYNLWPFIYDENKAILGHPDRIKPGTKVVIPPASKYGIDASDPRCVAKAKKRGAEIYARYR